MSQRRNRGAETLILAVAGGIILAVALNLVLAVAFGD